MMPNEDIYMQGLSNLLLLDRSKELMETDALYAFALDELLCRHTGKGGPAVCHLWRHPRAFLMGLRDSRLPGAMDAQRWLESLQFATAVRNTGGAAVPLDRGIVNISLILPIRRQGCIHFHNDFEQMYSLIRYALRETGYKVDKGEISGAYCPGDFDLSIGGLKFCGIAQRRQAKAYIVQAFVIAEGSGRERSQLVRDFYERAGAGASKQDYPLVRDDRTASLNELISLGPDAARIFTENVKRVIRECQTEQGLSQTADTLYLPEPAEVREMIEALRRRYSIE